MSCALDLCADDQCMCTPGTSVTRVTRDGVVTSSVTAGPPSALTVRGGEIIVTGPRASALLAAWFGDDDS